MNISDSFGTINSTKGLGKIQGEEKRKCITCSHISSNMLRIALKKHHFKPNFQKSFSTDGSALRASEIAEVGEKRASCRGVGGG